MIPLPPLDPALPALGLALDGAAMREMLARSWTDARGVLAVQSCRPCYVRYKPGTSCLVQYELTMGDSSRAGCLETLAHIAMYAGDRARQVWSRRKVARLAEETARRYPHLAGIVGAYLPDLQAILQRFPMDRKLPALLQAASAVEMSRRLGEVGLVRDGFAEGSAEVVRYKPGRKALLRYRPLGPGNTVAYGKLHGDDRGALLFQMGCTLLETGIPTPRPLAYLPDLRLVVHGEGRGHRLRDLQARPGFAGRMADVAEVLSRLHGTRDPRLRRHSLMDESKTVIAAGLGVGTLLPDFATEVARLAGRVAARLEDVPEAGGTGHGGFSDAQGLGSNGGGPPPSLRPGPPGPPPADRRPGPGGPPPRPPSTPRCRNSRFSLSRSSWASSWDGRFSRSPPSSRRPRFSATSAAAGARSDTPFGLARRKPNVGNASMPRLSPAGAGRRCTRSRAQSAPRGHVGRACAYRNPCVTCRP